ncbi:glycine cleavage system aminomethyltransferase GcvT [Propionicicella superfundia]|uniref:glycine cleavage system aminomethyltransferase GcvT n=1 Tax=Propionicicella superfundia TaxID=348582 RepID=UPI0003FF6E0F|nr:glycine cleavage system aminomethyltransferase GcvT [Propionicicella superfundia]
MATVTSADDGTPALSRTPLYDEHVALGATMVPFAGWSMPVKYTSDLVEHHAVRRAAGLFDISHMAEIDVTGPDAAAFCDRALAGRLSALAPLQSKYTMILAEAGGIIDDLIVTAVPDAAGPHFAIVANASNRAPVVAALAERATAFDGDVEVRDASDEYALIAVQGPRARDVLEAMPALTVESGAPEFGDTKYYRNTLARFGDVPVRVARSGYTGEDGFELLVPAGAAVELWRTLRATGAPHGLVPAGLAARDTLRLEAGMPLYGHELSLDVLPAQAGLGRVVAIDKDDFVGRDAVLAGPAAGAPVLVGLAAEGRRAGRAGYAVLDATGRPVGEITSGVLSPTLGHPVAMAYVSPAVAEPGTVLAFDVRGTAIPATVTTLPFYRRPRA